MVSFKLNGKDVSFDVDPTVSLLTVLVNDAALAGAKYGCGKAQCGACKVIVDDEAVPSCVVAAGSVPGKAITTLSGLTSGGEPGRVQRAFIAEQAAQCGYCVSGIILTAEALLRSKPNPSEAEVRAALDENLCRCGAHNRMVRAVMRAAKEGQS